MRRRLTRCESTNTSFYPQTPQPRTSPFTPNEISRSLHITLPIKELHNAAAILRGQVNEKDPQLYAKGVGELQRAVFGVLGCCVDIVSALIY